MMLDDATVDDVEQMRTCSASSRTGRHASPAASTHRPQAACQPGLTVSTPTTTRLDIKPPRGSRPSTTDTPSPPTLTRISHGIFGKYSTGSSGVRGYPGWDVFRVPCGVSTSYVEQRIGAKTGPSRTSRGTCRRCTRTDDGLHRGHPAGEPYWLTGLGRSPLRYPKDFQGELTSRRRPRLAGTYAGDRVPTDRSFNERKVHDKRRAVASDSAQRRARGPRRSPSPGAAPGGADGGRRQGPAGGRPGRGRGKRANLLFFTSDNGFMEGQHRIPAGGARCMSRARRSHSSSGDRGRGRLHLPSGRRAAGPCSDPPRPRRRRGGRGRARDRRSQPARARRRYDSSTAGGGDRGQLPDQERAASRSLVARAGRRHERSVEVREVPAHRRGRDVPPQDRSPRAEERRPRLKRAPTQGVRLRRLLRRYQNCAGAACS